MNSSTAFIGTLAEFNAVAQPFLAKIETANQENKRLSYMRVTLLTKLMSGEIDVSSVTIQTAKISSIKKRGESFMSTYEKVNYSKSKIKKAGEKISRCEEGTPEYNQCVEIIDNWRAVHACPLAAIAKEINDVLVSKDNYLIVQRLKRQESIIGKLRRPNNTGLDRMQDLAGCRVIVPTVDDVFDTVGIITKQLVSQGHEIVKEDNYLDKPPANSGYRCYHIIVRYHSNDCYNNLFVEIQVRTRLQNSWATAVEIIDCIEDETLKAGTGKESYRYFFKLISGLFAYHEGTTIVDGIPEDKKELIEEIYRFDRTENIREKLSVYSNAIKLYGDYPDDAGYCLLITDMREKKLKMISFKETDFLEATQAYQQTEKTITNGMDVVLVAGKNFNTIRDSYSNYFLEAQMFLSKIAEFCAEYPEPVSISLNTSKNALKLATGFTATYHTANISNGLHIQEEGIGDNQGDTVYCPAWAITLPNSYLRYSGIIRFFDVLSKDGDIIPHEVIGPAIVALSTGACFYVDKPNWQYVSETSSIVIQPKEKTDKRLLLYVIGWLKSNVCTWDLLWNRHSHCIYNQKVFLEFDVPKMNKKSVSSICDLVQVILDKEHQFVHNYRVPNQEGICKNTQDDIDAFNADIQTILRKIEDIFSNFYGITDAERSIINKELKLKGYYTYS